MINIPLAQPGVQAGLGQCVVHVFVYGDIGLMVEERQALYPAGRQRKWPLWRHVEYINQRYTLLMTTVYQPR